MAAGTQPPADTEVAGERWRDALAELEYAERHEASPTEVERLADDVIAARVALFQAGVRGGWELPAFLHAALERDRRLLEEWPSPPESELATGDGR